jgi:hypothetical protein
LALLIYILTGYGAKMVLYGMIYVSNFLNNDIGIQLIVRFALRYFRVCNADITDRDVYKLLR